ncbi:hypothetical protein Cadr_000005069 [Camelus dromedarius]|uniref:Uncharacterized protein n=1 Tax=Camelus dromedarius TaxID=9838 RepID=A0A5N4EAW2_CAMDR|nr:hypothetical protein Cadr_000005069 [Camelus dromedarius]
MSQQQQGCSPPLRQGTRRSTRRRSRGDIVFQVLKQQVSSDAVVVLHLMERDLFNQMARGVTRLRREGADVHGERRATSTAEISAALRSRAFLVLVIFIPIALLPLRIQMEMRVFMFLPLYLENFTFGPKMDPTDILLPSSTAIFQHQASNTEELTVHSNHIIRLLTKVFS